jgi:hypothetical protein
MGVSLLSVHWPTIFLHHSNILERLRFACTVRAYAITMTNRIPQQPRLAWALNCIITLEMPPVHVSASFVTVSSRASHACMCQANPVAS